jgi:hypothetical protein
MPQISAWKLRSAICGVRRPWACARVQHPETPDTPLEDRHSCSDETPEGSTYLRRLAIAQCPDGDASAYEEVKDWKPDFDKLDSISIPEVLNMKPETR